MNGSKVEPLFSSGELAVGKKKTKHDDEGKFIERKKMKECTAGPVRAGLISRCTFANPSL